MRRSGGVLVALLALAFAADPATAARDRRPPAIRSLEVRGDTVTLRYSETVRVSGRDAYVVAVDGRLREIRRLAVSRSRVSAVLAAPVWSDDVVAISTVGRARDRAGNRERRRRLIAPNRSSAGCSYTLTGHAGSTSAGPWNPAVNLRSTGVVQAAVLFADFEAAPADEDPASLVFEHLAPMQDFLASASFGRLALQLTPLPRWLRLPGAPSDYLRAPQLAFERAVAAADPLFDFSATDLVYVVYAQASALDSSHALVPARPAVTADGRMLRFAVTQGPHPWQGGPRRPFLWSVLAHETAHTMGLPDLYDYVASPARFPLGPWDPMSEPNGADFFAWHKWKLGWIDASQLRCVGAEPLSAPLTPVGLPGGVKAVVVRLSLGHALVVETRARMGSDAHVCGEGVLVYDVDATRRVLPVMVHHAVAGSPPCEAALGVGPDRVSSITVAGYRVEVAAPLSDGGYVVRVSRS
jgi:M6 family metalloprotease-like protein